MIVVDPEFRIEWDELFKNLWILKPPVQLSCDKKGTKSSSIIKRNQSYETLFDMEIEKPDSNSNKITDSIIELDNINESYFSPMFSSISTSDYEKIDLDPLKLEDSISNKEKKPTQNGLMSNISNYFNNSFSNLKYSFTGMFNNSL